ncbi:MAG: cytochrome c3 family protein [Deltaproteobacteria bacterium]
MAGFRQHASIRVRVAVLLLLLGPAAAIAANAADRQATFDQETCALCHIRDSIYIDPSYLSNEMRDRFGEERVCMSCHNGSVLDHRRSLWRGAQHPPPGEREGASADRTCSPCHSPHEQGGWKVLRNAGVRLSGGGDSVCSGCHPRYRSRSSGLHRTGFPGGGCGECHRAHGGNGKALLRGEPDTVCFRCHDAGGLNRPGGHPVATRTRDRTVRVELPGCTGCHPVHRDRGGGDPAEEACTGCHRREAVSGESVKTAHRPGESCLSCHSFHARSATGGRGFRTSDMVPSLLCGSCHGEMVAKNADDAKRRGTHPADGLKGKESLCFGCHRVHRFAPGTPMLKSDKAYFCLECHEEQNTIRETEGILLAHPVFERVAEGRLAPVAARYRLALGPAGEIVCGTCHSVHRSVPGTPLLAKGFEKAGNCFLCHERFRGTRHGPKADRGQDPGCASCHKVHGMRTGKEDPWGAVCSSCHLERTGHPPGRKDRSIARPREMKGFDERGRAVSVGGALSCPTCHEVHGTSNLPKMLRKPYRSSGFLCTACHRNKESVALTPHDLRGIAGNGICEPCHLPHGGSAPWMWGMQREERDPTEGSCRSCHREKGMGFPVPEAGHPSGMMVARPLPIRYPLYGEDWNVSRRGVLGCPTCHQVHGDDLTLRQGERGALLRTGGSGDGETADRNLLCRTCHAGEAISHGAATCTGCHPPHARGTESAGCRLCHGSLAKGGADRHLGRGMNCRDCHRIHADGGPETLTSRCTACHSRTERIRETPHAKLGEMVCEPCHPSHPRPDDASASAHSYEEPFRPDRPCLRCHHEKGIGPVPGWMEHPKSRREVPTNYGAMVVLETPIPMTGRLTEGARPLFPLFDEQGKPALSGRLGCLTCHDPHLGTIGKSASGERSASGYLRDPSGIFLSEICAPCHRNEAGEHAASFHKLPRSSE